MLVTNLHQLAQRMKKTNMPKIRDIKRFKIVEQIILVLLLAVIIPTTICAFIVNNINQHAVRNELQYSAMSMAEAIASNIETFSSSGKDEINQIIVALKHIKSDYQKNVFLKDVLIHSSFLSSIEMVEKKDITKYQKWENYSKIDAKNEKFEILNKINNGQAILATVDRKVFEDQVFNIYKKDNRQIYIINKDKKIVAAHNYNEKDFKKTINSLPENLQVDEAVIFGKIKNQPLAYFNTKNPELTIIVNTTHHITKTTINTARSKIILALCASALFIIFVVGLYTYHLYINIRQLFKGIMALSKGNYKRKVRLLSNIFTPYEIMFLAFEFNKMADEINTVHRKLKHTNKELKKLDELRANLIDTVSHEFRTPLTSIKGYTSRLLRQDIILDEETKQKSLKIIKNQSERLSRMIEDLLVIPDIEGANLNLLMEETNLYDALNDAILTTKHKESREVKTNISENLPNVFADKDRLEQVLVNILENAYKYSTENSSINIEATQEKNLAIIKVSNSYEYIPPEQLQKLFGKFIRIDDKTTRTTRGTGLGLFIVKGLVKAMNGSIELQSTKDNVFSVILKLPIC